MVEKEGQDLFLQQMRDTPGYQLWVGVMRRRYLDTVRQLMRGSCSTNEDLMKLRTKLRGIEDAIEATGASKEDVIKWMELR